MILSFHPCFEADAQIILGDKAIGEEHLHLIERARAIILPQSCHSGLYYLCRSKCRHIFPNYDARFLYPGKVGQTRLFERLSLPYPVTRIWPNVEELENFVQKKNGYPHKMPFIFKANLLHEGDGTFVVRRAEDFRSAANFMKKLERSGQTSFITQEYISTSGRVLRVVIIGRQLFSYWKEANGAKYVVNLSKGARTNHELEPALQDLGKEWAKIFQQKTGVNLAAIDFIFRAEDTSKPLFLEVNYYFGRRGLGGSLKFYELLYKTVKEWLDGVGVDHRNLKLV